MLLFSDCPFSSNKQTQTKNDRNEAEPCYSRANRSCGWKSVGVAILPSSSDLGKMWDILFIAYFVFNIFILRFATIGL